MTSYLESIKNKFDEILENFPILKLKFIKEHIVLAAEQNIEFSSYSI